MGKTQSKRSVDITTETKKATEDESTEKMEKIEDLDKKEVVNGDATISEKSDSEKKYYEETEHDKDMTTEKGVDVQASGDAVEPQNVSETEKDDGGLGTAEEISPLADESIKKSKKEKVKKKWSFRSISFGKKDKQKPAKNEDDTEDGSAATNGADANEKTTTEPEETQKDKSANGNEEKTTENHENGNATPNELNGDEQKENKNSDDDKSNDITANTTAEQCEPVQNETAAVSSELSEKTENTAILNETKILENAAIDDASNNGNGVDEKLNATDQEAQKTDVISVKSTSERTSSPSTNGDVIDQIHQNGDHGESEQQEVIEKSKAQIEVNSNTDKKVSAATLESISFKSINPSYVQIHSTAEKLDEIIQNNDESVILKSTDIEINTCTVDHQPSLSEVVNMVKDFDNKVYIETVSDLTSEPVDNKTSEERLGVEPSPPPLPISPPPSQVSVFAFINSEEPIEDSTQTKNSEPSIINLNKTNEKETIPILSEPADMTEVCNRQETETITIPPEQSGNKTTNDQVSQLLDVEEIKNNEAPIQSCDEIEEAGVSENVNIDNKLPSSEFFEETNMDEETTADIAAAVINGITETAVAIIDQQLKCTEKQISDDEQPVQTNEETKDVINENVVVFEFNDDKEQNDEVYKEDKEFEHNVVVNTISSIESPLVCEQINNFTTECSLDISTASNLTQGQDEMASLKKSDNVDEEHLDPTKEFANTKDFKDNVIVAETQDLPVACE